MLLKKNVVGCFFKKKKYVVANKVKQTRQAIINFLILARYLEDNFDP